MVRLGVSFLSVSRPFPFRKGFRFQTDNAEPLHFQDRKAVRPDSDFIVNFRRMAQGIEDISADGIRIDVVFDRDVQQFFYVFQ